MDGRHHGNRELYPRRDGLPSPSRVPRADRLWHFHAGRDNPALKTRLAEQTAVNLAHTVFKVDTVAGFIEICHLAILGRRDAQSACKLAYCVKHSLSFRSGCCVVAKIRSLEVFYQRQRSDTALLPTHGKDIDYRQNCTIGGGIRHPTMKMLKKEPRKPVSSRGWTYRRS